MRISGRKIRALHFRHDPSGRPKRTLTRDLVKMFLNVGNINCGAIPMTTTNVLVTSRRRGRNNPSSLSYVSSGNDRLTSASS